MSDSMFFKSTEDTVDLHAKHSSEPIFYYFYNHRGQVSLSNFLGAPSTFDLGQFGGMNLIMSKCCWCLRDRRRRQSFRRVFLDVQHNKNGHERAGPESFENPHWSLDILRQSRVRSLKRLGFHITFGSFCFKFCDRKSSSTQLRGSDWLPVKSGEPVRYLIINTAPVMTSEPIVNRNRLQFWDVLGGAASSSNSRC